MAGREKEAWRGKLKSRLTGFTVALTFIFSVLATRLFYLQVVSAEEFAKQSSENSIRIIPIEARRGDIFDRQGNLLATSKPVFAISLANIPDKELDATVNKLAALLGDPLLTPESVREKIKTNPRRYEPVIIKRIPADAEGMAAITRLEEHRLELPGVNITTEPLRFYPHGSLAGHILGYVGQITQKELEERKADNYRLTAKIGKTGIERYLEYDNQGGEEIGLRGKDGAQQVEVNAYNRKIRDLVTIPPRPGDNVILTLDLGLQQTLEQAMDEVIQQAKKNNPKAGAGAAVVIDVKTGAILAIASKPNLNPNDFVDGSFEKKQNYYNDIHLMPGFNRAVQGTYPPGSTFKPITAMAALSSGNVLPEDSVLCSGGYWRPGGITCWQSHGRVDLERAMATSCNTYFQWAGEQAGIKKIVEVARQFGLGQPTGALGILGEASGILPSPDWKREVAAAEVNRRYQSLREGLEKKYNTLLSKASPTERERLLRAKEQELSYLEAQYRIDYNFETGWHPFDTYNTSIGQGSNNYTMLQLANYVATLANGGTRWRPYIVEKVISARGEIKQEFRPEVMEKVQIAPEIMAAVRKSMLAVTQPGGTASFLFNNFPPYIRVAAKTGTAQTGRGGDDPDKDYHGLFIAFAPYDDPQIAFAGVIEYARHGGDSAGLVAKAVLEKYFGLTPTGQRELLDGRAVE
ncbi:MAG: penicillin-binding protein 2 [Clostridia bacterium]|nr:penicillin-binding protein 2 [Clostridia bacterium]